MKPEINHELLKSDIQAVVDFVIRFLKSFGPSPKKVNDKPLGFFEEQYIRFRFRLVDMGPVKWFKTVVVIIGGIVLYFVLFRHSSPVMMIVTVIIFAVFYGWVWGEELAKELKDDKAGFDRHFGSVHKSVTGMFKKLEEPKKK